jgi:hypothetical protein
MEKIERKAITRLIIYGVSYAVIAVNTIIVFKNFEPGFMLKSPMLLNVGLMLPQCLASGVILCTFFKGVKEAKDRIKEDRSANEDDREMGKGEIETQTVKPQCLENSLDESKKTRKEETQNALNEELRNRMLPDFSERIERVGQEDNFSRKYEKK